MSGGGRIIIQSAIRAAASLSIVAENLTPRRCSERDFILAKSEAEWTDAETHRLLAFIGKAYDEAE